MIDELFLYDRDKGLFKTILAKSSVIQGRYFVSPNYGHDLNTNNLDSFIKDPLYGLMDVKQKYPCAVCMPPRSRVIKINGRNWEQFYFNLFFLCRANYTGQNQIKSLDKATNTSGHHSWYDWKDMKEVAINFYEVLCNIGRSTVQYDSKSISLASVLNIEKERFEITRLTKFNNDSVSGVSVLFNALLFTDDCNYSDYPADILSTLQIPSLSVHTIHKH